ncbi:glycosyltransferase family 4 protein [uncultured Methanobacterium sp.]|uniref:glycosyltransferase family 4 protein n=1 Tax=uncultured Methanobacterium sp. TaxID=176306 RepID=UPI002AA7E17B|nr:glycosyltransferase family 4 protein [uncultured Methanobacterium sp.]
MNIILVNYMETTEPGGINKVVREIASSLSQNHRITVLQPNPLNLPNEELIDGYQIIRINSRFGNHFYEFNPQIYFYLKKNLKKLNPDIIHIHGYHTSFSLEMIYLFRRFNPKIPIIFSPHYDIFSHDTFAGKYLWNVHNFIGKHIIKSSDLIIAASNFESKNINNDLNVPKDKIMIIPHGVDTIDIKKENKKGNLLNLLYVGYLMELKGVQHLIKVLDELINEKNVQTHLTIIGEGPYEDNLRSLADKLDLNEFINWRGFIHSAELNELLKYYKKSNVFLLLSQSENYGIVVTEALAMGTPTIVTKRTALKEFLNEPGCFGVDYPPDPKKVSDLILKIYNDEISVGPLSNKIRTWKDVIPAYEAVYENW